MVDNVRLITIDIYLGITNPFAIVKIYINISK